MYIFLNSAVSDVPSLIQLVENEEIIGTLIETNDRLVSAIEMYDRLSASEVDPDPESTELAKSMAAAHLTPQTGDKNSLFSSPFDNDNEGDDNESPNKKSKSTAHIHPDLQDLTFGSLREPGGSASHLPAPLKPSFQVLSDDDDHDDRLDQRPSLSDFSDYESSDEDTHSKGNALQGPSRRNYITVSDDDDEDDPFADPFADKR